MSTHRESVNTHPGIDAIDKSHLPESAHSEAPGINEMFSALHAAETLVDAEADYDDEEELTLQDRREPIRDAALQDTTPYSAGDDESEVSTEQYMRSLLQRYGCAANEMVSQGMPVDDDMAPVASDETEVEQPARASTLEELARTSRPPECRDHLKSMRQLANASARHAVGTHSSRRLVLTLYGHLAAIAITLLCGGILATTASTLFGLDYILAFLAVTLGCALVRRYCLLAGQLGAQLARTEFPEVGANPSLAAEHEPAV